MYFLSSSMGPSYPRHGGLVRASGKVQRSWEDKHKCMDHADDKTDVNSLGYLAWVLVSEQNIADS